METEEFGILDSIPDYSNYKSYTDRYFTKRYVTNVDGTKNNDIMIMFHSNRIALLCLAPSHYFFQNKEEYTINFNVGKVDRRKNTVKGKGKKGGQLLNPKSVICKVEYKDGTSFDVPCCMKGKLIEVNEELVKSPELLREMPDADGFIAVILSSIEISDTTKKELLTPEQYLSGLNNTDGNNGDVANE